MSFKWAFSNWDFVCLINYCLLFSIFMCIHGSHALFLLALFYFHSVTSLHSLVCVSVHTRMTIAWVCSLKWKWSNIQLECDFFVKHHTFYFVFFFDMQLNIKVFFIWEMCFFSSFSVHSNGGGKSEQKWVKTRKYGAHRNEIIKIEKKQVSLLTITRLWWPIWYQNLTIKIVGINLEEMSSIEHNASILWAKYFYYDKVRRSKSGLGWACIVRIFHYIQTNMPLIWLMTFMIYTVLPNFTTEIKNLWQAACLIKIREFITLSAVPFG